MADKLTWITGFLTLACCMTTLGQKENEDSLMPAHHTVIAPEESPHRGLAEPGHACGSVDSDRAYELDEAGRIKAEWPLPVEATPVAINGHRLLVHQFDAGEEFMFVTPEGSTGFTLIDPPEAPSLGDDAYKNRMDCPVISDDWNRCWRFVDVATGSFRTIAYRFRCT